MIGAALLGLAAGDVYGAGVEGLPADRAAELTSGPWPSPDELYTDDTQQALVLAYHLLEWGRVVPAALASDLFSLARPVESMGCYRGAGQGFRAFVLALEDGASPAEAAQPSAGNGAAMRSVPVALRFADQPERLVPEALLAASVTHADPRGVAAGVAVPAAVRAAAAGFDGPDILHEAAEAVTDAEHRSFSDFELLFAPGDRWHTMSRALRAASTCLHLSAIEMASEIGRHAATTSASGSRSGVASYAPASVVTGLAIAATADDPVSAVRAAVALGGDADTTGAIAGAVASARIGFTDWPWQIPNRDLIEEIGSRLVTGGTRDGLPPLAGVEEALDG